MNWGNSGPECDCDFDQWLGKLISSLRPTLIACQSVVLGGNWQLDEAGVPAATVARQERQRRRGTERSDDGSRETGVTMELKEQREKYSEVSARKDDPNLTLCCLCFSSTERMNSRLEGGLCHDMDISHLSCLDNDIYHDIVLFCIFCEKRSKVHNPVPQLFWIILRMKEEQNPKPRISLRITDFSWKTMYLDVL